MTWALGELEHTAQSAVHGGTTSVRPANLLLVTKSRSGWDLVGDKSCPLSEEIEVERSPDSDIEGRGLVVLVHTAWMHTDSWDRWAQLFDRNGYDCFMARWPGESPSVKECRAHPELVAGIGLDDVLDEVAAVISGGS
jgi:hypothetical protein